MLVYLITIAVALGLLVAAEYGFVGRPRVARALWAAAFVVLLAPAALRYDIGVDYSATMESAGYLGYWQLYHLYASQPPALGMDPGFYLLIRLLNVFTDNPQWMFATISAATYALVLRACRRLSPVPVLSVALFLVAGFYFESYNIARQWFAIACVLNALEWVGPLALAPHACGRGANAARLVGETCPRRSFARYALWVLLGASMHLSCLLWLVVWPLTRLRLTPTRAFVCLAGFVAVAFVGVRVVQVFFAQTRFGLYFGPASSVYVGPHPRVNAIVTSGLTWAFALFAPYLGKLQSRRDAKSAAERGEAPGVATATISLDPLDSTLLLCATLALALNVSAFFVPAIVDRVARYFAPMLILLMPRMLVHIKDARLRRLCCALIIVAWLAATYVQAFAGGQYGVVPYQSVFSERCMAGILS